MTSDSENWEQLQNLFHLAENVPNDGLDAFLLNACAEPALRLRAKTLIMAERREHLESAPSNTPALSGGRIGPYSLLRHLGSGGVGAVYLVERIIGGVVQRAALKVLSLHATGPFFIERFAREQHILASLDHPRITRMMDAGISDNGQPYLVMEYVDGLHLDTYCDDRSLGVPERLRLFLNICDAVSYAHRNLIVHLDLKPSNILVTEAEGSVKLLDFGTSKLIRADGLLTTTVMATPAYASPEQLRNETVTTACDIYALGAVLFELLTGRRPNQDSSVALMIERSIKEVAPEPITAGIAPEAAAYRGLTQTRLLNLLRGDLATIVAKCLSPRPKDRYVSVDALITDVERYLDGRPILARPQTTTYRLTKFVRRNRKAVVTWVFATIALVSISSYALWRQHEAVIAGRRAMQMQTFMKRLFGIANSNYTGKPAATVPELLNLGVKLVPGYIADPSDRRAAEMDLAVAMDSNSDYKDAEPVFSSIIADAKATQDFNAEAEAGADLGGIEYLLGKFKEGDALTAEALTLINKPGVTTVTKIEVEDQYAFNREANGFRSDETLRMLKDAVRLSQRNEVSEIDAASALTSLGLAELNRSNVDAAEPVMRQALAKYQRDPSAFCEEGQVFVVLGRIADQHQDFQSALGFYRQGHERLRKCSGDPSMDSELSRGRIADETLKLGDAPQAVTILEDVVKNMKKLGGAPVGWPFRSLAKAYIALGQFDKAEIIAKEQHDLMIGKINPKSRNMGLVEEIWAEALAGQHRYPDALTHAQLAVDAFPKDAQGAEKVDTDHARATLLAIQSEFSKR